MLISPERWLLLRWTWLLPRSAPQSPMTHLLAANRMMQWLHQHIKEKNSSGVSANRQLYLLHVQLRCCRMHMIYAYNWRDKRDTVTTEKPSGKLDTLEQSWGSWILILNFCCISLRLTPCGAEEQLHHVSVLNCSTQPTLHRTPSVNGFWVITDCEPARMPYSWAYRLFHSQHTSLETGRDTVGICLIYSWTE